MDVRVDRSVADELEEILLVRVCVCVSGTFVVLLFLSLDVLLPNQ